MVKVCAELFPETNGYYMDGRHEKNLLIKKKIVSTSDTYGSFIIAGDVGSGKSTKAAQDAKFLDPTFTHERMCQSEAQFREQLEKLQRGQAIVLDEAFESLNSTEAARRAQMLLVNLLQIIRQKNIFVFIVLPDFFSLNKTVALFSTSWLIRTYTKRGRLGFFEVFGKDKKRELYIKGKKMLNYHAAKPNYRGRFTKFMTIDEGAYRKMKLDNLNRMLANQEDTKLTFSKAKQTRDSAIKKLLAEGRSHKDLAALFDVSTDLIYKIEKGVR